MRLINKGNPRYRNPNQIQKKTHNAKQILAPRALPKIIFSYIKMEPQDVLKKTYM